MTMPKIPKAEEANMEEARTEMIKLDVVFLNKYEKHGRLANFMRSRKRHFHKIGLPPLPLPRSTVYFLTVIATRQYSAEGISN
ncbi:hypothetical protein J6590_067301 [Homalodisca vitripennis]|nr:hypothetical protein J6590_067301 [Homalodisca vitripennis]